MFLCSSCAIQCLYFSSRLGVVFVSALWCCTSILSLFVTCGGSTSFAQNVLRVCVLVFFNFAGDIDLDVSSPFRVIKLCSSGF